MKSYFRFRFGFVIGEEIRQFRDRLSQKNKQEHLLDLIVDRRLRIIGEFLASKRNKRGSGNEIHFFLHFLKRFEHNSG